MDFFRRPVVILILATMVLVGGVGYYFISRRPNTVTNSTVTNSTAQIVNLTNVDPTDYDSVVKDELDLANNKAAAVNSSFVLSAVVVELPKDLLPNTGTNRYIYATDKDKNNNWVITISQKNGNYIRSLIPKADYIGEVSPINKQYWKFNYVMALQIAEKGGGLDWRENNDCTGVNLTLRQAPPKNWLSWIVEYLGADGTVGLTKTIDANSGQIFVDTSASSNNTLDNQTDNQSATVQ